MFSEANKNNRISREVSKENIVEVIKIADWLYALDEVSSEIMYLIVGKQKALLVDTGYGFSDFRGIIKEITDLPLTVVCSHGHGDHVFGNYLFDTVYISEADYDFCLSNDCKEAKERTLRGRENKTPNIHDIVDKDVYLNMSLQKCEYKFVKEGDIFDLGGITLEVYELPGHSKGSIGLYSKEHKALFCGDVVENNHYNNYTVHPKYASPPDVMYKTFTKMLELDIQNVWPAHGDLPAGRQLIEDSRDMLVEWAHQADPSKDAKFGSSERQIYDYPYKNISIHYTIDHLNEAKEYMKNHGGKLE